MYVIDWTITTLSIERQLGKRNNNATFSTTQRDTDLMLFYQYNQLFCFVFM